MDVTSDTIRILHVDDDPELTDTAATFLKREHDRLQVESTKTTARGISVLQKKNIDCIVSGYALPDKTGIEFLKTVREKHPDLPFILHTDVGNEVVASKAISAGATDYIRAGTQGDAELIDSVLGAVSEYQNNVERRQNVRRYQTTFDDPKPLVGILDVEGTVLEVSQTAEEYILPDIKEMIGKPFWETAWWDKETKPHLRRNIKQAASGEYVEYEAKLTDAANGLYSVTGTIQPVSDETGQIVSLIVSAHDIAEQKARGHRLKKEKRLRKRILNTLPDAFYQFDTDGYLVRWNEELETATGYSKKEIREMYITEFVPDDEIEPVSQQFQEVISERRSVTIESAFETKNGERIPYEFTGRPIETAEGEIKGLTGIGRNISGRKRQQRRFEAVFNNIYQFTGLMDPDGTLLEVNQTALSFGDLDRGDVVGENIWDVYWFQTSEAARETAIEAVKQAREGDFFRREIEVQGARRNAIIDFSVRPVTDEDGNVTLLIPEGRDITRLKEREQQLKVTNRVLRHNIRNQLNIIRGTAASFAGGDTGIVDPEAELIIDAADDLLETAETTRQLNELVEDKPEPKSINITACVETAVTTISDRCPQAEISLKLPETASVEAITGIEKAIEELFENAIVHNKSDNPRVTLSVATRDSTVEVVVTDHAGGIPDLEREILTGDISIDPLAHGKGLGLWYAYRTVHYSGGSITISEQPDGSKIRVSLPRCDT